MLNFFSFSKCCLHACELIPVSEIFKTTLEVLFGVVVWRSDCYRTDNKKTTVCKKEEVGGKKNLILLEV